MDSPIIFLYYKATETFVLYIYSTNITTLFTFTFVGTLNNNKRTLLVNIYIYANTHINVNDVQNVIQILPSSYSRKMHIDIY